MSDAPVDPRWPKVLSLSVHEFRTPMTVVAGYIRMLLKDRAGPLSDQQRKLLEEAEKSCARLTVLLTEVSDLSNLEGGTAPFKCRAGSRYLYVDEFGKVSYCSQRRGEPGTALLEYGRAQMREAFDAPKGCEDKCTIACVRRASVYDQWRPQRGAPVLPPVLASAHATDGNRHLPIVP